MEIFRDFVTPGVRPCRVVFTGQWAIARPVSLQVLENLIWHKIHLRHGIYLFKGALTNFHLSQRFDLKYTDLNLLIASQR